jgi:hypothetical protein
MPNGGQYVYRDPGKRSLWLTRLIRVLIALVAITAAWETAQFALLSLFQHRGVSTADYVAMTDAAKLLLPVLSWCMVALALAAALIHLMWVYRTLANVHALGAQGLRATPIFAVVSYLIPFFNLYLPPIVMSEVWRASIDAPRWSEQKKTPLVRNWWTLVVLVSLFSYITTLAAGQPHNIASLKSLDLWMIAVAAGDIVMRLWQIRLIEGVAAAQTAQHARIG